MQQQHEKKFVFCSQFFSKVAIAFILKRQNTILSLQCFTISKKLNWECVISFSSRTFKNCQKCSQCWTIKFVQDLRDCHYHFQPFQPFQANSHLFKTFPAFLKAISSYFYNLTEVCIVILLWHISYTGHIIFLFKISCWEVWLFTILLLWVKKFGP